MQNISIQGYKSIKSLDLVLAPINILIGANGSGKTNFLSFFEFLKNIYNKNLREYVAIRGNTDKFLYSGDKVTNVISAKLSFDNTNAYSFSIKKGESQFIFTEESLWHDLSYYTPRIDISAYGTEAKVRDSDIARAPYVQRYLTALQKYHFHDTGSNSPFSKDSNIETDKYMLYETGQNLAAFLFHIQQIDKITYNFIIRTIQSIAPFFLDFYFVPNEQGFVRLLWQSKYSSTIYGVNDLSDGTIRFIALTVLFLQPNLPNTIIIDEPELGLHPVAISKLASMMQSVAAKGCQVIAATQSTDLISHFMPHDIVTVDQINGASIFQRLDSDNLSQWLEDYTVDDLWKRNIISTGQPNF